MAGNFEIFQPLPKSARVAAAGSAYHDAGPKEAYVDGKMVSHKGWTALASFMRECLKLLGAESRDI
ncbi:hypothetical protein [Heliomarina baculiformis]|uniref:hypothetical protein n=1 Tax=Heliomarina baculiformis TaxID=2872036 RepID=UPI001EE1B0CF|nr:hypothetical protein [Heliomarina baculiformis]